MPQKSTLVPYFSNVYFVFLNLRLSITLFILRNSKLITLLPLCGFYDLNPKYKLSNSAQYISSLIILDRYLVQGSILFM